MVSTTTPVGAARHAGWQPARLPARRRRIQPQVELLEDRTVPTIQAVSVADPNLLSWHAGRSSYTTNSAMSQEGRYIVFSSEAPNLVLDDTNSLADIFLRDMETGTTTRISTDANGAQANGHSKVAVISADGRYVAFLSDATNLVENDTNGVTDVFVKDLQTGAIVRASTDSAGNQANADSGWSWYTYSSPDGNGMQVNANGSYMQTLSLSADGRFVAFSSNASNLVGGDGNGKRDVFVKDLQTGLTVLASSTATGGQAQADSHSVALSANGRYVAFDNEDYNWIPGILTYQAVLVADRRAPPCQ
jgi:hypothetical protein